MVYKAIVKENEPKEQITLERHAWRALGILATIESIRILATDFWATNNFNTAERLILGLAIPAWYIWGEGVSAMLTFGRKVDESEYRKWLKKDLSALFGFLNRK